MRSGLSRQTIHPALQLSLIATIASSLSLAGGTPATAQGVSPDLAPNGQLSPSPLTGSAQGIAAPETVVAPDWSAARAAWSSAKHRFLASGQPPDQPAAEGSHPNASTVAQGLESGGAPAATPEGLSEADTPSAIVQVLSPSPGTVLDAPATTIVVQYPVGSQMTLQVNGAAVDASLVGRTETDSSTQRVTQTWYGVGLQDGANTITAQASLNDQAIAPIVVQVVVRGAPSHLTVSSVEPQIAADGRSTATIQGEVLDADGNRSNRNAVVTLESSSGDFVGNDSDPAQPGFQVQAMQGYYTATLQSSLEAGLVRLRATAGTLEAFNQLQFQTALQPTLIAGVIDLRFGARGTDFYGSFRDFLPPDGDHSMQLDARGAVFATTQIGEWQFTAAFNSDRPLNRNCNGESPLFREDQSCDQTYPVYGDRSTSDIVTPSTDHVYARIERTSPVLGAGSDFLMWGDYNISNEFATRSQLFTATNRSLHGLYGNYNLGDLRITGFYGVNVQGFQRDAIAPDGTSGDYFLSRRLLVDGSEAVFIETEEFNRPGTVLTRQQLTRGTDYQIDYDRGSLLFSRPILQTGVDDQGRVLVRRIIVTYQYEDGSDASIYGGRVQYNLSRALNRESWLGATYLRENQGNRHFELYGADALVSFGRDGQLIAEYAQSTNGSDFLGSVDGSAVRVEAQSTLFEGVHAQVYFRSTTAGFANNATTSFVPGQTRYGAEVTADLSPSTALTVTYDHEDNVGIAPRPLTDLADLLNPGTEPTPGSRVDNSLTTFTVGLQQQIDQATLNLDWIHRDRQDRLNPEALTETSDQLRSRLTLPITDTLTFRAQNELNLSGSDPLYPNRTILGLAWQAYPGITFSLNHQFFQTQGSGTHSITSLNLDGEYHLGSDTTIAGHFALMNEYGLSGSIGIDQGWTIAPGLRATFTYEHIFGHYGNATGAGAQFPQPYAVGQSASSLQLSDASSYSVSLAYTDNPDLQANARFEHRTSSEGSNTVISASVLGRLTPSLTVLGNYQQTSAANQRLSGLGTTSTLRFGMAYRNPDSDEFNALLRYEHRQNPSIIPDNLLSNSGTGSVEDLFALEAIYAPNWRWEFYGKFALRHSTSYLASDVVSSSTITLGQLRATYRLGDRWDVSGEGRWISQPSAGYSEMGLSLEAGYYLTPNMRLSAGYSLGAVSDRDFNGSRSASGLYLGFTLKLDNNLLRDFGIDDSAPSEPQTPNTQTIVTDIPEPGHTVSTAPSEPGYQP